MSSIHFKLITNRYSPPSDSYQCNGFSSMIKNKVEGYANIKLYNDEDDGTYFYKYELINSIAKVACIPEITITDIYFYSKI